MTASRPHAPAGARSSHRAPAVDRTAADERDGAIGARRLAQQAALRRQTFFGAVSLGAFVIVAAGALLYWRHVVSVEEEQHAALEQAQNALRAEVSALDLHDPAQAQRAVQRLEQTQSQWRSWPTASWFSDSLVRAGAEIAAANKETELQRGIKEVEQEAASHPAEPAAWKAMDERVSELEALAKSDKAVQQQLLTCAQHVDEGYLAALRAAIAASPADRPAARSQFATAEALAANRIEAAERTRDAAARTHWEQEYEALVKQEDTAAAASYDAAAIAKVAWKDLLPGTTAADWAHSAGGPDHQVQGETLSIESSPESHLGVVVLRGYEWRDCQIECDVTLASGGASLLLRAGKKADPRTSATAKLALTEAKGSLLLPAGQPTHLTMLVLGSRLTMHAGDKGLEAHLPARTRSGGFAIVTEPGTSLRLSHLRVKDLP
ncbi:MAG TPA: hypothetical protein VFZ65_01380 [Planctomycetota bacterium]|nr:hypothetical protein [Planctomycetota bacterium]